MMQTHRNVGTTAENNAWTLPEGIVSVDREKHAIRLHDGVTPGGFEVIGSKIEFPSGPGPGELIAGNHTRGFYGELASGEFLSYDDLALAVGMTGGTNTWPNDTWFKFSFDNRTFFVPKYPARQQVSWQYLYQLGLVYGTDNVGISPYGTLTNQLTMVEVAGHQFKVRLFKGTNREDGLTVIGYYGGTLPSEMAGSEWDDLMVPLTDGTWASYDEATLHLGGKTPGSSTPVQETDAGDSGDNLFRGYTSVQYMVTRPKSGADGGRGWRPILELIS